MTKKLRIVLAQINPKVGDIAHNLQLHLQAAAKARDELSADVIVFPELSLIGYPPEDLLLRPSFIHDAHEALQKFTDEIKNIHCLVSHPHATSQGLFNSCSLIHNGAVLGRYAKQFLPNYGVFDEARYFTPGNTTTVVPINGIPVGLVICEDLWYPGPCQQAAAQGARIILSPNASPFEINKHEERVNVLSKRAKADRIAILYNNLVGAQDDIVFDGGSMAINEDGSVAQCAGFFNETLLPVDLDISTTETQIATQEIAIPNLMERIYNALVLGVRDYVAKNNVSGVLVGVSGGIDSALTLAIAVDALGADRVQAIMMPSRYSAEMSLEDGVALTVNLGVASETISIEPLFKTFLDTLTPSFKNKKADVTEENIQARCRGVILMALANKHHKLVLTTGNRSEMAVGYCTLYGDMAGGFAVLKDVPKTLVYELANYRNAISPVIPERTIVRAPTAELAPNQKDEDSLPPYSILDQILERYLNHSQSADEIIAAGFDAGVVNKVITLLHRNEYKRRQSAIGPRINYKSFGRDWRYPVMNGYKR